MPITLPISETFTSIQGEGLRAGVPSFFIRTSGCNLRCRWCDTPYASWNPEGGPVEIERLVELAVKSGVGDVVITGGEPMMFDGVEALSQGLRKAGLTITIETAGTILRSPATLACDLMSISPKLAGSTPLEGDARDPGGQWRKRHEERRINLPALQGLIDGFPGRQIKFVVERPEELSEIDSLLASLQGWNNEQVLLMPEGVTVPAPGAHDWLLAVCAARRWRFCPRLHLVLFGNRRGT